MKKFKLPDGRVKILIQGLVTALIKDPLDAGVIIGIVIINSIIGYVQQAKAEKAIQALSKTMVSELARDVNPGAETSPVRLVAAPVRA